MKLIVGLGNPGKNTKRRATTPVSGGWTRSLAPRARTFARERASRPKSARAGGSDLWLLKPETFMNESGRAVGALAGFYRIRADEILVAHDELDLPPGEASGSSSAAGSSGHNGLRDIAPVLGTQDFWRLRIGIGHPRDIAASEQEVVDYVLHPPRAEERKAIEQALDKAMEVWPLIARTTCRPPC